MNIKILQSLLYVSLGLCVLALISMFAGSYNNSNSKGVFIELGSTSYGLEYEGNTGIFMCKLIDGDYHC